MAKGRKNITKPLEAYFWLGKKEEKLTQSNLRRKTAMMIRKHLSLNTGLFFFRTLPSTIPRERTPAKITPLKTTSALFLGWSWRRCSTVWRKNTPQTYPYGCDQRRETWVWHDGLQCWGVPHTQHAYLRQPYHHTLHRWKMFQQTFYTVHPGNTQQYVKSILHCGPAARNLWGWQKVVNYHFFLVS